MTKNILFSIGARGGSKGYKNKNITEVNGKPLIGWSIEQALNSKYCDEVIVTTDSSDIKYVAESFGAKVPFTRPEHLSNDTVGKWQVWQHCLSQMEGLNNCQYDFYVDLDCTSPLRSTADIDNMIDQMQQSQHLDGIFTVCEARKNPYFNLVEYSQSGHLEISKKLESPILSRQTAPKVFEHVASIYVLTSNYLRKGNGLLSGATVGYDIGMEKSFDFDSALDKEIIEYFLRKG